MSGRHIDQLEVIGYQVSVDEALGHLWVEHSGAITWDELQEIKNLVWDAHVRAIEVYPSQDQVVNHANIRHLWRLGPHDFCPDLLGEDRGADALAARCALAWAESRG